MLYAVGEDIPDSLELRLRALQARLEALQADGRLVIVAEFDSPEAAKEWAETDPYIVTGAYANVVVKAFRQVPPK